MSRPKVMKAVPRYLLQKILYLAHMIHLGRTGEPLVNGRFEAWDYGPVQPNLYKKVAMFGDSPIQDVFFDRPISDEAPETRTIDEVSESLLTKSPGQLVAITHWDHGAWARSYRPNVRGIVIPDSDILDEYRARNAA
ncbi:DUF4065 domain-containing protein [Mesorhizobium sp. M0915]|uniref:Panacea domain-containing protein n=1 Tax=Mesorhizobium sp. M0915 TaxID=2957027 RepID=UPI00333576EC